MIPDVKHHPLVGCWLKINRAREHAKALNQCIDRVHGDVWHIRSTGKFNPADNSWVERVESVPYLPPEWGAFIGDAAHNYRSALHLLAFELAFIDKGGKEKPGTAFPLVTPDHWNDPGVQAGLKFMTASHRATVKACQSPVPTDHEVHPLLTLADLSNDDKHRVIQPAFLVPEGFQFELALEDCGATRLVLSGEGAGPLETGTELFKATLVVKGANPQVKMQGTLNAQVSLRDGTPLRGLFEKIDREVVQIVERFAPEFETAFAVKLRGVERRGRFHRRTLFPAGSTAELWGY